MKTSARAATTSRRWLLACCCLLAGLGMNASGQITVSGSIRNNSLWPDNVAALTPPGDGDGDGAIAIGLWSSGTIIAAPEYFQSVTNGPMPVSGNYPYTINVGTNGIFFVVAWADADDDGEYDVGEPRSVLQSVTLQTNSSISSFNVIIIDDADDDDIPDWWEVHWFENCSEPLGQIGAADPDLDGLKNSDEYTISVNVPSMSMINPADWDSDDDGMDDKWEYDHYSKAGAFGLNPTVSNRTEDIDGDGLSSWQEYNGTDGKPIMAFDKLDGCVIVGKTLAFTPDDLNPLDIDTDFDLLIDSYEAAWYDPTHNISPSVSGIATPPANFIVVDFDIAREDSDNDGMTNYREMCLLASFREGGANEDKWAWQTDYPIVAELLDTDDGNQIRVVLMSSTGADLAFGLNGEQTVNNSGNIAILRSQEWTDPTEGTGYAESLVAGHDTDNDFLPDGWEVDFNLDPKDATADNGPFGDPDGDGVLTVAEFMGQDNERFTTHPFINGTGDESNPNTHNHRPDETYAWRWASTNFPYSFVTDPRLGLGINKFETLGSALPTASVGTDNGWDTDDDGLDDLAEISTTNVFLSSSMVHAMDPFRPKAALITSTNGIVLPDPTPAPTSHYFQAGMREDLQRRDWTIECYVKLLATNMSGNLFNFQTSLSKTSSVDRLVYRLALSNNVPTLTADDQNGSRFAATFNALPVNQWVHLAGVWSHANNSLKFYLQGVLSQGKSVQSESAGALSAPATNVLAFGASSDGSFVNNLVLDEIRIWGVARSEQQISDYARRLVPQGIGDDIWIDYVDENGATQLYFDRSAHNDIVMVNGGSLFIGEPGVVITNAICSFKNRSILAPDTWGIYTEGEDVWIDDGDQKYSGLPSSQDILIHNGGSLAEGENGRKLFAINDAAVDGQVVWADKDSSGDFKRDTLLAYYRFDDGGTTVEDFARKAKTSLLRTSQEDYTFGDRGYALATNNFNWTTNAAPTLGTDARGADDSDEDGMPDAWETVNHLDAYDNGAGGETSLGSRDGLNGPLGDSDHDGLNNLNEFRSDTNPGDTDSDADSISDAQEDFDGDGLANGTEQELGSRPDAVDTDDDGLTDNQEQSGQTNPAGPTDPPVSRSMVFGGSPGDYLEVPLDIDEKLSDFTLEAMVNPSSVAAGVGTVIRRVVQDLPGGSNTLNYVLGLENNGGSLRVYAGYNDSAGATKIIRGGTVPANGSYTHVAATYKNGTATLSIYVNGALVVTTNTFSTVPLVHGKGGNVFLRIGEDFGGLMDEVRLWKVSRSASVIASNYNQSITAENTNLVHYFRFDDGQADTNIFPLSTYNIPRGPQDYKYLNDWEDQWRHAAIIHGNVTFSFNGGILPPASLRVILDPIDAINLGAKWTLDGGAPLDSGFTVISLPAGIHSLSYSTVSNYTAPATETITLTNGTVMTLTRSYQLDGTLEITLEPLAVRTNGASFRVDGGAFVPSETVVSLSPGAHLVSYLAVAGWDPPTSETVIVQSGVATEFTRTYSGDLDNDGMPDDWESLNGLNPNINDADLDADNDGLTNLQEYQLGTNPQNPDTDGDGFSDMNELLRGSNPLDPNSVPPKFEFNDFDGDGATDLTVYWPAAGNWYIRKSAGGSRTQTWGWNQSTPVPGDYDGDNVSDIAVFFSGDGKWYLLLSGTDPDLSRTVSWVSGEVVPVVGDFDGDNRTDFVVYKPEFGNWYIAYNTTNVPALTESVHWGWSDTRPVTGDYDGDGIYDIAVYWPSSGLWYILRSSDGTMQSGAPIQWGWNAVTPVPGDYDGDRVTDLAVYHQASGIWYILKSSDHTMLDGGPIQWGWSAARPVPGDYDNDGATDIAVYHQQTGNWYIRRSSDGALFTGAPVQWGWNAAYPPLAP